LQEELELLEDELAEAEADLEGIIWSSQQSGVPYTTDGTEAWIQNVLKQIQNIQNQIKSLGG
jgi:hypothetical protein